MKIIYQHTVFVLSILIQEIWAGDHEKQLYMDLLATYNPLVRPVKNETDPVVITLGMDVQQIVDIVAKSQLMVVNVWMRLDWRDVYLEWDPKAYGGVAEVRLPIDRIWKPDVLLYNSADTQFDSTWPTNAVVYSTGDINWIPPGIIKSTCKIDVQWFPFDDQYCPLKFGSWTFSGAQIDLRNGTVSLDTYTKNGEWKLMNVTSIRNSIKYDCCPDPYYDVTFTVWVRRRTLYYTLNLVVPATLISALTLLGFTLPQESGEKLALGVTIFMSLCVFLLMAAETLPRTSEAVPLISTYLSVIMMVVSASVVFTVLVLNFHHRAPETHVMSPFMRSLFLEWLPWLLMMSRPEDASPIRPAPPWSDLNRSENRDREPSRASATDNRPAMMGAADKHANKSLLANVLDLDNPKMLMRWDHNHAARHSSSTHVLMPNSNSNQHVGNHHNPPEYKAVGAMVPSVTGDSFDDAGLGTDAGSTSVLKELRFITDRMRKEDEDEQAKCDWRYAAMVVDRLCMVLFSTFLVISTFGILYRAPHLSA